MEGRISLDKLDKKIVKEISVRGLYRNDFVSIMQNLGPQFGVNVTVLQKEGEVYKHYYDDQKERSGEYSGHVPHGQSYVGLSFKKRDIDDFWEAVRTEERSQQNSTNKYY